MRAVPDGAALKFLILCRHRTIDGYLHVILVSLNNKRPCTADITGQLSAARRTACEHWPHFGNKEISLICKCGLKRCGER